MAKNKKRKGVKKYKPSLSRSISSGHPYDKRTNSFDPRDKRYHANLGRTYMRIKNGKK